MNQRLEFPHFAGEKTDSEGLPSIAQVPQLGTREGRSELRSDSEFLLVSITREALGQEAGWDSVGGQGLASMFPSLGLLSQLPSGWEQVGRMSSAAPGDPCIAWSPGPRHIGDAGDGLGCG